MKKIFVNMRPASDVVAKLEATGNFEFDIIEEHIDGPGRTIEETRLTEADIMFCDHPPVNFDAMTRLKLIQLASVGYTQLAGLGIMEKEIRVCNARGVFDVPIAEWNISMMINLARNLRGMIRNQETGNWDRDSRFQNELRGATVGLWGYGGIGRETARLGKALGLRIHALTRKGPARFSNIYGIPGTGDPTAELPDQFFTQDQRMEFLSGLDFLVLSMPLSPANEGIVGEAELKTLPSHAFVLNPARGPLIKETALLQALNENWIAGAALDTHYQYPMPPDHPLWKIPNVIMTPHISGSSGGPHFLARVWDIFAQNLERLETNQPLLNEIDVQSLL